MPIQKILLGLTVTGLFACSHPSLPAGSSCKTTSECASGLFCTEGACSVSKVASGCVSKADCSSDQVCTNKLCVTASGSGTVAAPTLDHVLLNGDGTLTLVGTHLDTAVSATATPEGGTALSLALAAGADTTKLIAGSIALVAGVTYDFVVKSATAETPPVAVTFTVSPGSVDTTALKDGSVTAAKLGSDLKVGFLAWSHGFGGTFSNNQVVANNTTANIVFDSVEPVDTDPAATFHTIQTGAFNDGSAYSTAAGVFVAPAAGAYLFNTSLSLQLAPGGSYFVYFIVTHADASQTSYLVHSGDGTERPAVTSIINVNASATIKLATDDIVTVGVSAGGGHNVSVYFIDGVNDGQPISTFSGHRVY